MVIVEFVPKKFPIVPAVDDAKLMNEGAMPETKSVLEMVVEPLT